jgi:hypothetical protein
MLLIKEKINYSKITGVSIDGIDHSDYPDYCDAYIDEAFYNGIPLTEEQLEELNEDRDFVYNKVMDFLF